MFSNLYYVHDIPGNASGLTASMKPTAFDGTAKYI